ncbi:MAG TPA: asparagine synthase (glutamine-hydrolyzing) [Gemmatimonadales bacterium]
MCGVAGLVDPVRASAVSVDALREMTDLLTHRGPEAQGHFAEHGVGLGHRRLRIIDLAGGLQPMFTDDRAMVTVYNGEIYNYRELRATLEAHGHRFRTASDTETILYAYRQYGDACVDHFRGMFAIALYDRPRRRLLLIRDRLGIKPLYYAWDGTRLVFASEIKPILRVLGGRPAVNLEVLDFYLSVGYVPGEDTLFRDVRKLLPGHTLAWENGQVRVRRYWDLDAGTPYEGTFADALDEFRALATESVRLRLVSDVPLGAFLSGGVDSSTIVALMSDETREPVKTFAVGYTNQPESSELAYARQVARLFRTDHHEFILEPMDFLESVDHLLTFAEEPLVESAAIALLQLSRLAKEHVTVILSGEGGDEILAGYPLHRIMPRVDRLHRLRRLMPAPVGRAIGAALRFHEKATKYWDWTGEALADRYLSISNDVTRGLKARFYANADFLAGHHRTTAYFRALWDRPRGATALQRMSYVDIKSWLPDDLLLKADKMTMAASLELRVPFLDHQLVEFAVNLPDAYRLRGSEGKYLLKKLMEPRLPREIVYRRKQGFPVPIAAWFRGPLRHRVAEVLLDDRSRQRGYFRPQYVEEIIRRHQSGRQDLSRRLFALLALELWHRKYID